MKYSLHGNNEDSGGYPEMIFSFLINILLTLKTRHLHPELKHTFSVLPTNCLNVSVVNVNVNQYPKNDVSRNNAAVPTNSR